MSSKAGCEQIIWSPSNVVSLFKGGLSNNEKIMLLRHEARITQDDVEQG